MNADLLILIGGAVRLKSSHICLLVTWRKALRREVAKRLRYMQMLDIIEIIDGNPLLIGGLMTQTVEARRIVSRESQLRLQLQLFVPVIKASLVARGCIGNTSF